MNLKLLDKINKLDPSLDMDYNIIQLLVKSQLLVLMNNSFKLNQSIQQIQLIHSHQVNQSIQLNHQVNKILAQLSLHKLDMILLNKDVHLIHSIFNHLVNKWLKFLVILKMY